MKLITRTLELLTFLRQCHGKPRSIKQIDVYMYTARHMHFRGKQKTQGGIKNQILSSSASVHKRNA